MSKWAKHPTASEVDRFLIPYGLGNEVVVERVPLLDGNKNLEHMMLVAWNTLTDELAVIIMNPPQTEDPHADLT